MTRTVVAVVGDVHGALVELDAMCDTHEIATGDRIAAVLQAGDLGVFPVPENADRATRKRGEDRLFVPFVDGTRRLKRPLWFVRGNHEDFGYLEPRRNRTVDAAGMMTLIADGRRHEIQVGSMTLRIAGLGGIEPTRVRPEKAKDFEGTRYIDPAEVSRLSALAPGNIDVLLTHDAPLARGLRGVPDAGSERISQLVDRLQPRLHVWGHYGGHRVHPPFNSGRTLSLCLNQPDAVHIPSRDGGLWILDPTTWSLERPAP